MSESAGSCAVETQYCVSSNAYNPYQMRKIAQQEVRKNELVEKRDNGNLSKAEAVELTSLMLNSALDKIANAHSQSICYMA